MLSSASRSTVCQHGLSWGLFVSAHLTAASLVLKGPTNLTLFTRLHQVIMCIATYTSNASEPYPNLRPPSPATAGSDTSPRVAQSSARAEGIAAEPPYLRPLYGPCTLPAGVPQGRRRGRRGAPRRGRPGRAAWQLP